MLWSTSVFTRFRCSKFQISYVSHSCSFKIINSSLYCIVRQAVHFLQTTPSALAAVKHLLKGLEYRLGYWKFILYIIYIFLSQEMFIWISDLNPPPHKTRCEMHENVGKPIFYPMDKKMISFNLNGVLGKVLVYA